MRDEIIKKNLIITLSSMLVFFLFFSIIFSYFSKRTVEQTVKNLSTVVIRTLREVPSEEKMKETIDSLTQRESEIEIFLAKSTGTIIKSSSDDSIGTEKVVSLEAFEIELAKTYRSEKDRTYVHSGKICYIVSIDEDYILKVTSKYDTNKTYILLGLFLLAVVVAFEIAAGVLLSSKTSYKIISQISSISGHLSTINEGNYVEIELDKGYSELEPVMKEINQINETITKSIAKIKTERDKMNFVIDNSYNGIIILSQDGKTLLMNEYARNVLNLNSFPKNGTSYQEYISDEKLLKRIEKSLRNKGRYETDIMDEKTETIYSYKISYLEGYWSDNEFLVGLLFINIDDVTEEKMNDRLREDFIQNSSHELKTPITSIGGFAELLLANSEVDQKTKKYASIIYEESEKMKETIQNLLYLSTLNSEDEITREKVYFDDVIKDVISAHQDMIDKANLKVNVSSDYSFVYSDPGLIYHLIKNLIENAIKYNKKDGEINIEVKRTESLINLVIEDTGIGISEKHLNRIFDRFYRTDKSRNRETGGTGLGLHIVKQIVAKIDAKIEVSSTIGKGTSFKIIFNKEKEHDN